MGIKIMSELLQHGQFALHVGNKVVVNFWSLLQLELLVPPGSPNKVLLLHLSLTVSAL